MRHLDVEKAKKLYTQPQSVEIYRKTGDFLLVSNTKKHINNKFSTLPTLKMWKTYGKIWQLIYR